MRSSNEYGCSFFEEVVVGGVAASALAPGSAFLLYKLSQVDDAFKLRRELAWTFGGGTILASKRTEERACSLLSSLIPLLMS